MFRDYAGIMFNDKLCYIDAKFGTISDMLWLSQIFESLKIADMLEIPQVLRLIENL